MREVQDHKDFSITSWYDKFQHVTIKSIILELSEEVLKSFQFVEPSDDSENEATEEENICLPQEFKDKVKNAFNTLGGTVFVKNNWHAPTDAKMFSFGNTLKAENLDDIKLFCTTSSIIQEDFSNIKGVPFCMVLRTWISIHPASEFRCIVINDVLRGITPRDWPTFYAHFKDEGHQIIDILSTFFSENIKMRFPRKTYIFDVVLSYPDKPFLLDFSPLTSKTNLYAFSWKEICPLLHKEVPEEIAPVFRYLESDIGIMTRATAIAKLQRNQ